MHRLTDTRKASAQPSTPHIEFYREEFIKHQRCLRRQREYYSEPAISSAEQALARILAELDWLCSQQDCERVVSQLLRTFDTVTGLSARSKPKKAH
jgi:hypothetical protein